MMYSTIVLFSRYQVCTYEITTLHNMSVKSLAATVNSRQQTPLTRMTKVGV